MVVGEPALPQIFRWRGADYEVAVLVSKQREFKPEGHKSGNVLYLRKHWFEVITTSGEHLRLYCERQARERF